MKVLVSIFVFAILFQGCVPSTPKSKSGVTFNDERLNSQNQGPLSASATATATPTATATGTSGSGTTTTATYDMLIAKCGSCHNGPTYGGFGSMDLTTMINDGRIVPGNPEASRIYIRIVDGTMPPGNPLTLSEISAVHTWIKDELPQSPSATATPSLPADSYASLRVKVFIPKCIGCHNDTDKNRLGAGYSMESYAGVMEKITPYNVNDSEAWVKSYNKEMPPTRNGSLTNAELADFASWINKGAPEN